MMMHQNARDGVFSDIANEKDSEHRDRLLDMYLRWRDCATEWDADQWGFDPTSWMAYERHQMELRIAGVQA